MKFLKKFIAKKSICRAGLWFIDIPRTSSTSVKTILSKKYGKEYDKTWDRETKLKNEGKYFSDHTNAREIKNALGPKTWNKLFTFSIVRNPWERFLSLYKFRVVTNDLDKKINFKSYVLSLKNPTYRSRNSPFFSSHYHMSMSDFLMDGSDNLLVNKIFFFEDRQEMELHFKKRFSINLTGVYKEKLSEEKSYRKHYDDESAYVIEEFYFDDIKNFNYNF